MADPCCLPGAPASHDDGQPRCKRVCMRRHATKTEWSGRTLSEAARLIRSHECQPDVGCRAPAGAAFRAQHRPEQLQASRFNPLRSPSHNRSCSYPVACQGQPIVGCQGRPLRRSMLSPAPFAGSGLSGVLLLGRWRRPPAVRWARACAPAGRRTCGKADM